MILKATSDDHQVFIDMDKVNMIELVSDSTSTVGYQLFVDFSDGSNRKFTGQIAKVIHERVKQWYRGTVQEATK